MNSLEQEQRPSPVGLHGKTLWRAIDRNDSRPEVLATPGRQQLAGSESYSHAVCCHIPREDLRHYRASSSGKWGISERALAEIVMRELGNPSSLGETIVQYTNLPGCRWSDWETYFTTGDVRHYATKATLINKTETFVDKAKRLHADGNVDSALDVIYDKVDHKFKTGRFGEVNMLLEKENPATLSIDLILGLLTATLPARSRIPSRATFAQKAEKALRRRGDWESDLFVGLVD